MQTFGKYTANDANTASVNTHTIFDLDIGLDGISFGNNKRTRVILSGGISNIFNLHYISSETINATADRYYEPDRAVLFSLTYDWPTDSLFILDEFVYQHDRTK